MEKEEFDCGKDKSEWLRMRAKMETDVELRDELRNGNKQKDYFPRITGKLNEK